MLQGITKNNQIHSTTEHSNESAHTHAHLKVRSHKMICEPVETSLTSSYIYRLAINMPMA